MKKLFLLCILILISITMNCQTPLPNYHKGGVILGNFSNDPEGLRPGQLYWNTTNSIFRQFNGVQWEDLTSKQIGSFDNIGKIINTEFTPSTNAEDLANTINSVPTFIIEDDELPYIIIPQRDIENPLGTILHTVVLKEVGKGTYGIGGTQLTSNNVQLIATNRTTVELNTIPTTQSINVGEIFPESNIVEVFNNMPQLEVQDQDDGYVVIDAIFESVNIQYLFVGVGGLYGNGGTSIATEEDFIPLDQDTFDNRDLWRIASGSTGVDTGIPATFYNQPIRHGNTVFSTRFMPFGTSTHGIQNADTSWLWVKGNQGLYLQSINPNQGHVRVTSNGNINAYALPFTKFNLRAGRNFNDNIIPASENYKFIGIEIDDVVDISTKTGNDTWYSALRINPSLSGTGKHYSILSERGDALFKNGSFSIEDIAAPTGENYMVTVDENGLLSSNTIPSGGSSSTGLEAINEGNGIGWRLIGKNPDNYGNIGLHAVDLSFSPVASTTSGATGEASFCTGFSNTASGAYSVAFNNNNTTSGTSSASFGSSNVSSANQTFTQGQNNTASTVASAAFGAWGTVPTIYSTSALNQGDRIFNIAAGYNNLNRRDIFTVIKGDTSLPAEFQDGKIGIGINNFEANSTGERLQVNGLIKSDVTTAQIDAAGVKIVPTVEWIEAQGFGSGGSPNLEVYSESGTLATNDAVAAIGDIDMLNGTGTGIGYVQNSGFGANPSIVGVKSGVFQSLINNQYGVVVTDDLSGQNATYSSSIDISMGSTQIANMNAFTSVSQVAGINATTASIGDGLNQGNGTQILIEDSVEAISINASATIVSGALAIGNTLEVGGELSLVDYGAGNRTGTATYGLGVDATGNVIETVLVSNSNVTVTINAQSTIDLDNILGEYSNMAFPNANETYTLSNIETGGKNKIRINADNEPTITGARKIKSPTFVPRVDHYLCVENNGIETVYFLVYAEENINPNLYTANDAAQPNTNESNTVSSSFWTTSPPVGNTTITSSNDNSGTGNNSIYLTNTSNDFSKGILTFMGLEIGQNYEFKYWHKSENAAGDAAAISATMADLVGLQYNDPGAPTPGDLYLTPTLNSFTWVERSFILEATATTGSIDIFVTDAGQTAEANNKVWIDNITFKKVN